MPRTKKSSNKKEKASLKVQAPGSKSSIERMKYEIANEFGVNLGANASSRENGIVGGQMTKRLIENSKSKSSSTNSKKQSKAKKRSRKKSK